MRVKPSLILLFCLVVSLFVEPTITPILFNDPSLSLAQACDEFHGDANCKCNESIFNPCCPWWEPEKCAAFKKRKKDVAQYVEDYARRRGVDFLAIGLALKFVPGPSAAVGQAIGSAALVLAVVSEKAAEVRKDPFTNDYLEPYPGGDWPNADSLGLTYTGWWWNDYPIGVAQGIAYYTDFITHEADRYTSCRQVGPDACPDWYAQMHKDRVNWGLYMYGWYHGALAEYWWNLGAWAEQEGFSDEANVVREVAQVTGWVEQEFENDWD